FRKMLGADASAGPRAQDDILPTRRGSPALAIISLLRCSRCLLKLAALCRHQQFEQFLGYFGLKALGVDLVQADNIGNDQTVFAIGINVDLRLAGGGQQSPRWIRRILSGSVIDVSGFSINDLLLLASRPAIELSCPGRRLRDALVIHFALTGLVDEREIGSRGFAQGARRGSHTCRGHRRTSGCGRGGRARRPETRRAHWLAAQAPAR